MAKKVRASGRNVGKVFNPVLKLVFENYPFSCLSQLRSPHFRTKLADRFSRALAGSQGQSQLCVVKHTAHRETCATVSAGVLEHVRTAAVESHVLVSAVSTWCCVIICTKPVGCSCSRWEVH